MPVFHRVVTILALVATLPALTARGVDAQQQLAYSDRAPRFLAFVDGGVKPLDVQHTAVLNQRLALDLDGVTVKAALDEIIVRSGLRLVYRDALLPADARVHLRASEITVAAALAAVLLDAGLDVGFDRSGGAVLVRRSPDGRPPLGTIVGRVMDSKTQAALVGATVVVQGTSHSAASGNDGRYRIAAVAPGTYTVRARYIGYAPGVVSITVSAGQEATADFTLEKSAQRLDEVVTTGTMVPTEVKALPTPVTVIDDSLILQQRPHSIQELFRQVVPGAVGYDMPDDPSHTMFSVRGASTLGGARWGDEGLYRRCRGDGLRLRTYRSKQHRAHGSCSRPSGCRNLRVRCARRRHRDLHEAGRPQLSPRGRRGSRAWRNPVAVRRPRRRGAPNVPRFAPRWRQRCEL